MWCVCVCMWCVYVFLSISILTLVIWHEKRMRHIVICGLLALPHFFHITSKTAQFSEDLLNMKRVFWFSLQLLCETFLTLRRNQGDMIKNLYWSSFKIAAFLITFYEAWIFSTDFSKKIHKYQTPLKKKPDQWEPRCSMRTDWWTDMT